MQAQRPRVASYSQEQRQHSPVSPYSSTSSTQVSAPSPVITNSSLQKQPRPSAPPADDLMPPPVVPHHFNPPANSPMAGLAVNTACPIQFQQPQLMPSATRFNTATKIFGAAPTTPTMYPALHEIMIAYPSSPEEASAVAAQSQEKNQEDEKQLARKRKRSAMEKEVQSLADVARRTKRRKIVPEAVVVSSEKLADLKLEAKKMRERGILAAYEYELKCAKQHKKRAAYLRAILDSTDTQDEEEDAKVLHLQRKNQSPLSKLWGFISGESEQDKGAKKVKTDVLLQAYKTIPDIPNDNSLDYPE